MYSNSKESDKKCFVVRFEEKWKKNKEEQSKQKKSQGCSSATRIDLKAGGGGIRTTVGVPVVFKEFSCSMMRACLIGRYVEIKDRVYSYCGGRVWSMTMARLMLRSAARRLASRNGRLKYFICVNG
ncbi:hypothetical protein NL676_023329 [Syzygium grande]|nr:hypothetical protein NL676_023329 [Syzygium grande]